MTINNSAPHAAVLFGDKVRPAKFAQPVKLGPRITARRATNIRRLIERLGR
jgi:hypothetical protein